MKKRSEERLFKIQSCGFLGMPLRTSIPQVLNWLYNDSVAYHVNSHGLYSER